MVWRTCSRTEGLHLLHEERNECSRVQHSLGHLIEICLVGRAAALYDTEEFIFHAFLCLDVDLSWEIALGIDLLVHCKRSILAITEIFLGIGLEYTFRECLRIVETGPDLLAFFTMDNGGTGVLAERKLAFR